MRHENNQVKIEIRNVTPNAAIILNRMQFY